MRSEERRILGLKMSPLSLTMFSSVNISMILPKDPLNRFPPSPFLEGNTEFDHLHLLATNCILFYDQLSLVVVHVQLPSNIKLQYSTGQPNDDATFRKKKGKCKEGENEPEPEKVASDEHRLITLDIFAGCGGLSEGLEQSGMLAYY